MRIRIPFAGAFLFFVVTTGYSGLYSNQLGTIANSKVFHTVSFFVITSCFYWILDTSRRRSIHFTLLVCTGILGVSSEFLQSFLVESHRFEIYNILANLVGSLTALGLSSWYHSRMVRRMRLAKHYQSVPGEDYLELGIGPRIPDSDTNNRASTALTSNREVGAWNQKENSGADEEDGRDENKKRAE